MVQIRKTDVSERLHLRSRNVPLLQSIRLNHKKVKEYLANENLNPKHCTCVPHHLKGFSIIDMENETHYDIKTTSRVYYEIFSDVYYYNKYTF